MLNKIKSLTNTEDKKRLLSNFFSLSVLQIFSYVLPLLTLPYLVRVLGVETFGLVSFAAAFIAFFNILVDYGFNLSATREVSIHRENKDKITEIYSSVLAIKFILIFVSLIILSFIVFTFEKFGSHSMLYFITFISVIGQALFPIWYFQGMERMKYITIINISSKVVFTIAIFVFVHEESDYLIVPLLTGLGILIGSLYALYIIKKDFNQSFIWQSIDTMKIYFKDSGQFFLSRVANEGNGNYLIFIIGIMFDNTIVGYYSMVEKLYRAFYIGVSPIVQVLYPYMANKKDLDLFKKVYFPTIIIFFVLSLILIYFSNEILYLFYGIQDELLKSIFNILFFTTIFGITNGLVGYPLLSAFGYSNQANYALVVAALISITYITICYLLSLSIVNLVFSILIYELISVLCRIFYVNKLILRSAKQ